MNETEAFGEDEGGLFDNEHARWFRGVGFANDVLAARGLAPVHVTDRETDSYGQLSWMYSNGLRFVVRANTSRQPTAAAAAANV